MGRAVKEKGQKQREAKSTPHAPTTPSMSERYGFRKLNMSGLGQSRRFDAPPATSGLPNHRTSQDRPGRWCGVAHRSAGRRTLRNVPLRHASHLGRRTRLHQIG